MHRTRTIPCVQGYFGAICHNDIFKGVLVLYSVFTRKGVLVQVERGTEGDFETSLKTCVETIGKDPEYKADVVGEAMRTKVLAQLADLE